MYILCFVGSHTTGATICLILKDFTFAKCNTYPSNYPNVQYRYIMIAVLHVCTGNSLWIPTHPQSPPFSKKDSRLRHRATGGASTRSVMTLGASFQTWPMELDSRSLANKNRNRNNWKWTSFKMRTLYSKGCVCVKCYPPLSIITRSLPWEYEQVKHFGMFDQNQSTSATYICILWSSQTEYEYLLNDCCTWYFEDSFPKHWKTSFDQSFEKCILRNLVVGNLSILQLKWNNILPYWMQDPLYVCEYQFRSCASVQLADSFIIKILHQLIDMMLVSQ